MEIDLPRVVGARAHDDAIFKIDSLEHFLLTELQRCLKLIADFRRGLGLGKAMKTRIRVTAE